jgi:hypothetical protein
MYFKLKLSTLARRLRGSLSVAVLGDSIGTADTPEPNLAQSIYSLIARECLLVKRGSTLPVPRSNQIAFNFFI